MSDSSRYFGSRGRANRSNSSIDLEGIAGRIKVRDVAAVHRARFGGVNNIDELDYFVDVEQAKRLLENGDVFLVKSQSGKAIEEEVQQGQPILDEQKTEPDRSGEETLAIPASQEENAELLNQALRALLEPLPQSQLQQESFAQAFPEFADISQSSTHEERMLAVRKLKTRLETLLPSGDPLVSRTSLKES